MPRKLRSTSSGDKPSVVRKHDDPTSTSQEAGGAPSSRSYSSEPGPSTSRQTDAARLRRVNLFTEVNAASIRLPPFSPNEALTWFRRAETQFRLKNILKATTKADHVVVVLPEEVFHRIAPWLDSQPDNIEYDTLKQELLKEFSLSPSERAQQILNIPNTPLGDRTPKQVWQEINTLCRLPTKDEQGKFHEVDLKKEIWLHPLPGNIREKLHDSDETAMDIILTRANALMDAHLQARPQSTAPASTDINAATPRGSNTIRRPFTPFLAADGISSYHKRFGSAAYNCLSGCRWKPRGPSKNAEGGPTTDSTFKTRDPGSTFSSTPELSSPYFRQGKPRDELPPTTCRSSSPPTEH
ncbi:Retrovirus-related Pol polyprotein from transposon opus [Penaeus vannamei]|uniref:Retrovirus-related Pol polyprotein from transposon opus n=1 Tax=Penaeus vannamei TaxID=6689 RepID=A0A423T6C6_PENVA|nr:Retrovirus-related Pol polyprotein from transposon opus [Penaeus vannamei]